MRHRRRTLARLLTSGAISGAVSGVASGVLDLVLPADCAGCGGKAARTGICPPCAGVLASAPFAARPSPLPPGLPPCLAAGEYAGPLRELILAYKERGRRALAAPLGAALARVVLAGFADDSVRGPWRPAGPNHRRRVGTLVLVPVPSTAAAIRARHGDHMLRLTRRAALTLRGVGCPAVVATPLRALPKDDSAHLDRDQRALAARHTFTLRPGRAEPLQADHTVVVVLDDVLTTGSTLAAVANRMWQSGVPVAFGVTLAATSLRRSGDSSAGL